ncbi:MAG: hypothetical protein KAY32_16105 [Candidatus Eisenbacteria sp.]|nr:hypothetical protein [Candidatus Eisenbacteria bacterium]
MPEGIALEATQQALDRAKEFMGRVHEQSQRFPGLAVLDRDIATARTLLHELEHALSQSIEALAPDLSRPSNSDLEVQVSQAFHEACSLVSQLYDDVRQIDTVLKEGQSHDDAITKATIHLQRLVLRCREAEEHLRETAPIAKTQ